MTLQKAKSIINDTLKGGDLFGRQYETAKRVLKVSAGLTRKGKATANASHRMYCDLLDIENATPKCGWTVGGR